MCSANVPLPSSEVVPGASGLPSIVTAALGGSTAKTRRVSGALGIEGAIAAVLAAELVVVAAGVAL
jgi:hypothetical protein